MRKKVKMISDIDLNKLDTVTEGINQYLLDNKPLTKIAARPNLSTNLGYFISPML